MPLFNLTRNDKTSDSKIVAKSKTTNTSKPKGGSSTSSWQATVQLVNDKLGKYKDKYRVIRTEEELSSYFDSIIKNGICAIDTETTGLNVWQLTLAGICLYTKGEKPVYIPVNHVSHITGIRYDNQCSVEFIKSQFDRCSDDVKWIMHHATYDIEVLIHTVNVRLHCYWDTQVAAYCLEENGSHKLKDLHLQLCPDEDETESVKFGDIFKPSEFIKVPADVACLYAAGDAIKTYDLYEYQLKQFDSPNLSRVYDVFMNMEMPIIDVVVDMEEYGVLIDLDYSKKLYDKYKAMETEINQRALDAVSKYNDEIYEYKRTHPNAKLDVPLNLSSPTQLASFFYDVLKVESVDKKTPRGTGEEILKTMAKNDICADVCNAILEVRGVTKLLSTYIEKLPTVTESDGRIHCKFNQYGAKTGRFSSSDPNLQNIPSHNVEIRKMFTAPEGRAFVGADFSQQEPVVTAHLSDDPKMRESFANGRDIYSTIASVSFNRAYEDCLEFYLDENGNKTNETNKQGKEYRGQAKKIVLGILYGRSIPSIAEQLNTDVKTAQHIYDTVLNAFPKLRAFMEESQYSAKTYGYVETAWGRRRHLYDMQLQPYEFKYKSTKYANFDPLSFTHQNLDVPVNIQSKLTKQLTNERNFKKRQDIKTKASQEGIVIQENTKKIDDATRQCVNARVQGSAADITKKAMIAIRNDERMKELDFHLVLQVHDEVIGECPIENVKECAERLTYLMIHSASEKITIPMKCDVSVTHCWYGDELEI